MDFKRKNKTNEEIELLEKSTLYGKPKDVKKGGYTCKNDSGGGLVIKRGKRFVIIGEFVCLCQDPKETSCLCVMNISPNPN